MNNLQKKELIELMEKAAKYAMANNMPGEASILYGVMGATASGHTDIIARAVAKIVREDILPDSMLKHQKRND